MSSNTSNISSELESTTVDFKAEILAGEIIDSSEEEIYVSMNRQGNFRRNYDRDVSGIIPLDDHTLYEKFQLKMNREGFYDFLPEELFHFDQIKKTKEELSFTQKHIIKKQQEENARSFFSPLEDAFSQLLVQLEIIEKNNADLAFADEFLPDFFNTNQFKFDQIQHAKLNYFLPLSYKFRGKREFIEYILSSLLNVQLSCVIKKDIQTIPYKSNFILGDQDFAMLGVNSFLGNNFSCEFDLCEIHIYDLERIQTHHYQETGLSYHLIKHVLDYFLPVHFTFSIHLNFKSNQNYFSIGSDTDVSILGYNCVLS